MEAGTRPYAAVPPEAAEALRPVLPGLADETIAAIAREVPGYSRALEGEFGQIVRLGVEVAFNRFVDLLADPSPDSHEARATYVNLGRGEFHAGRSLDTLLAAYRVGARLAWRRFVEAGVEAGLSPPAIYSLGEAIFAYIDELSAESAEGYAEEQSAAAGESERRRRRLVRLLSQHPPASAGDHPHGGRPPRAGRCRGAASRRWSRRRPATARRARRCWTRSPAGSRAGSARARSARRPSAPPSCSSRTPGRRACGAGSRSRSAIASSRSARPSRGRSRRAAPGARWPRTGWRRGRLAGVEPTGEPAARGRPRASSRRSRTQGARGGLVVAEEHLAGLLVAADPDLAADLVGLAPRAARPICPTGRARG